MATCENCLEKKSHFLILNQNPCSQIVTTSILVASVFVYKASEEFRKATVMTTIHSTTTPLSEVFFPAVTVCNINQVRKGT